VPLAVGNVRARGHVEGGKELHDVRVAAAPLHGEDLVGVRVRGGLGLRVRVRARVRVGARVRARVRVAAKVGARVRLGARLGARDTVELGLELALGRYLHIEERGVELLLVDDLDRHGLARPPVHRAPHRARAAARKA